MVAERLTADDIYGRIDRLERAFQETCSDLAQRGYR
jgi:hypothetical protein